MTKLTCALVLTTINDPILLEGYLDNFRAYGHLDQVTVYVIPDRKTPRAAYERCISLRDRRMDVRFPTLEEQDEYLKKLGTLSKIVPYDTDNRRNVGFLMAWEQGVDFLISIDDDNYCQEGEDFFRCHSIVCMPDETMETVHSSSGWFNVCELLKMNQQYSVYPRGFPYHKRHQITELNYETKRGLVRMNAGLWLQEPDLDAITWLVAPVSSVSFSGRSLVLGEGTWAPVNTQNTSMNREVIPSYYYIRMGYPLAGMSIDRYGDIFSGYFSQVCVRYFDHRIRVGSPVTNHFRNSHNYLSDAKSELAGLLVLEEITSWLTEVEVEGETYQEAYKSLSEKLEDAVEGFSGSIWDDVTKGYFHQVAYSMREWINACKIIS